MNIRKLWKPKPLFISAFDAQYSTKLFDVNDPEPCINGEFDSNGILMPVIWSN